MRFVWMDSRMGGINSRVGGMDLRVGGMNRVNSRVNG